MITTRRLSRMLFAYENPRNRPVPRLHVLASGRTRLEAFFSKVSERGQGDTDEK